METKLEELLKYIDPSGLDYQEWVNVGMALKHEGYPCSTWDEWSRNDNRYHRGECFRKWETFDGSSTPVTGGTIYEMASRGGYVKEKKQSAYALDWDAVIGVDKQVVDKEYVEKKRIPAAPAFSQHTQNDQLLTYISTLFDEEDIVSFVTETYQDDEGKYKPGGSGHKRKAKELIESLKRGRPIEETIGDYNQNAGAWIRFNPMNLDGNKNESVSDYKYALVESDNIDVETQYAIMEELQLPIACLVYSGNKSVHAIVKIGAVSEAEYKKRVDTLYQICDKNGLKTDKQNKNPSRLSRMPGVIRGNDKQYIIDTNIGKKSWEEWIEYFESLSDDLPELDEMSDIWDNFPPLAPCLIDGVLRQGHKMLISGASKTGKSFLEIELSIAIAEGLPFLKWNTKKGKVLYINFEIDRASCLNRFKEVYKALGIEKPENLGNITVWNLRGCAAPMNKLAPLIIRRAKKSNYAAIIVDPIYKVFDGDENKAGDVSRLFNEFDHICSELGSSVIYCHHHSKGGQGAKNSMDRSSGSGVFARDPDAILDLIEINPEDVNFEMGTAQSALRIEGTLREFASFDPFEVLFDYPVHRIDESGLLKEAMPNTTTDPVTNGKRGNKIKQKNAESRINKYEEAYDMLHSFDDKPVTLRDIAEYFGVTEKTVRSDIKKTDTLDCDNGVVFRK